MAKTETCPRTSIEIRVVRQCKWRELAANSLRASFEISIGNPRCYGRFLECQVVWALARFGSFEFSLGDTLRVYNYMTMGHQRHGRLSLPAAYEVASEEGQEWIDMHGTVINSLLEGRNYRIMEWQTWKLDPHFEPHFEKLVHLYESNQLFRDCLNSDLQAYLNRRGFDPEEMNSQDRGTLATYLLEELTVYQLQAEERPTVNIYPGGMMRVFKGLPSFEGISDTLAGRHFAYLDLRDEK